MKLKFWKKEEKIDTKEQLGKKKYGYRITICDPLGASPREVETFGAIKTRDNDGVVWLQNEEKAFKEIFPLDNDFVVKYSKEDIDKRISEISKTKVKPNENKLNKESKLLELKKLKKALENPKGSFLKIDKDGIPHIMYVRYRTSFIPLKWDLDFTTIHTPVEPLIKNVLTVQLEKMRKYNQTKENIITGGLIFFMLILVIWTGILGYFTLKMYSAADESKVNDLNSRIDAAGLKCAELYGVGAEQYIDGSRNYYESSVYNLNVSKTLFDKLNPLADKGPQVTGLE